MQREKRNKVGSRAAEESFVETALGKREVEAKDKYSLGFFMEPSDLLQIGSDFSWGEQWSLEYYIRKGRG